MTMTYVHWNAVLEHPEPLEDDSEDLTEIVSKPPSRPCRPSEALCQEKQIRKRDQEGGSVPGRPLSPNVIPASWQVC